MTFRPETDPAEEPDVTRADAERVCHELHAQLEHARAFMDQSRRLLRAATVEPRSFKPRDE
jgi:hypothetical protein